MFVEAHELGGKALLTLIGLHAGAALFHRLVLRDGVLQRMLPWTSASATAWKNKLELIAQHVKKTRLRLLANFKVTAPVHDGQTAEVTQVEEAHELRSSSIIECGIK